MKSNSVIGHIPDFMFSEQSDHLVSSEVEDHLISITWFVNMSSTKMFVTNKWFAEFSQMYECQGMSALERIFAPVYEGESTSRGILQR